MSVPDQRAAWARPTRGEHRWPPALAIATSIALQMLLPEHLVPPARYVLPALELGLLVALVLINPFRIDRESDLLRWAALGLTGLVGLANAWSVALLVVDLLGNRQGSAVALLGSGGAIWANNVVAFALIYWELDRGGPAARAAARSDRPDFLFPQMQNPHLAERDWEPVFFDYLYLSFTNVTAFSPTDVMPLSRWAKATMMVQAAVSLVLVVLVVARAINALA